MDIAKEIALIVCKSCNRYSSEDDVTYSTRLYETYQKCYDNVQTMIDDENNELIKSNLNIMNNLSF